MKGIGSEMNSVKAHHTQIITESVNMESLNDTTRFFLEQNTFLILKKIEFTSKATWLIAIIIASQMLAISFSSYTYIQANDLQLKLNYNRQLCKPLEIVGEGREGGRSELKDKGGGGENIEEGEQTVRRVGGGEREEGGKVEEGDGGVGEEGETGAGRAEGGEIEGVREGATGEEGKGVESCSNKAYRPLDYWKEGGGGCGFFPFGAQLIMSEEAQLLRGWTEEIIGFYMVILIFVIKLRRKKKKREEDGLRTSFQVESMPFFKHLKIKKLGEIREENGKEEEKREGNERNGE